MLERGTVYWGGAFAGKKREAREITVRLGFHAQFAGAIIVDCTMKGGRNASQLTLTEGWLVILEGWGHPSPPGTFGAGVALASDPTTTIHSVNYPLGDPRWLADFSAFLGEYVARSGAVIAADYRAHDFREVKRVRAG
jgi:hypothetical protein